MVHCWCTGRECEPGAAVKTADHKAWQFKMCRRIYRIRDRELQDPDELVCAPKISSVISNKFGDSSMNTKLALGALAAAAVMLAACSSSETPPPPAAPAAAPAMAPADTSRSSGAMARADNSSSGAMAP